MTTQPIPLHDIDQLVATYLEIQDQISGLNGQAAHIKAQLAGLGIGEHATTSGVSVKVREPNRSFNLDRAWTMLTPDQQKVCLSPDGKKVRSQLPEVLLEQCMDAGKGQPVVTVG
jgi:hypothetical protein